MPAAIRERPPEPFRGAEPEPRQPERADQKLGDPDSENDRNQPRFLIELSEYVTFERAEVWKEGRNPVSYKTLKELGIDLRGLKFKPMPIPTPSAKSGAPGSAPMTIAEAKKALAATFGVSPDDVEITIRG